MNSRKILLTKKIKQELITLELEKENTIESSIFWEQKVLLETALSLVKQIDIERN